VRVGSLVLFSVAVACYAQQDTPVAIRQAFEAHDASLQWFSVVATRRVDANSEVVLAEAAPMESDGVRPPAPTMQRMQLGVFLESSKTHQVEMVIDISPWSAEEYPQLDEVDAHSIRLHSLGDYGDYVESVRYFYDASLRKPATKIRYRVAGLESARIENGKLIFTAEYGFGGEQFALNKRRVTITVSAASAPPLFVVAEDRSHASSSSAEPVFHAGDQTFSVETKSQPSGIWITDASGNKRFFPAPAIHIGPVVFDSRTIWFARRFLDSDAYSVAGAIVAFDPRSHKYRVHELPEIGSLSGTAILADGDNIWLGLEGRPEAEGTNPALLRYNKSTGAVQKYAVNDIVYTINRVGETIYCGTSDGLYTIRSGAIHQYRFEPDASGKLTMVERPAPLHPPTVSHK